MGRTKGEGEGGGAADARWYLTIESEGNWAVDRRARFASLGVSSRYERRLRRDLRPGDMLVTYVTKACAFADVRIVVEGLSALRGGGDYSEGYPLKVGTRAVVANAREGWVDVRSLLEELDLTRGRGPGWRHVVRQTFRPIAAGDGERILAELEVARSGRIAWVASGRASAGIGEGRFDPAA